MKRGEIWSVTGRLGKKLIALSLRSLEGQAESFWKLTKL